MAMTAKKKVVLLLGLHDNDAKEKRKVLKTVSTFPGLDLISMDMKASKLTVVGLVDPIVLVTKLRKLWHADILSVGPASKEEDKETAGDKIIREGGARGGVVKEEEGDRKREEVTTAVLVESRPADMRPWPQAVAYPAQHPYPYRPDQYAGGGLGPHHFNVPGGLGARENPHNNNLYVAGGHGARENRPNSSYVAHGYGARRNHPNSAYGTQDPNGCAIC
ncbi:unnamed protein product [Urochloa humidicola]